MLIKFILVVVYAVVLILLVVGVNQREDNCDKLALASKQVNVTQSLADEESPAPTLMVTEATGKLQLGQTIILTVPDLGSYFQNHPDQNPQALVPYIDGRPLTGLYPRPINLDTNTITYYIQRTSATSDVWRAIFMPAYDVCRAVTLTVGFEEMRPFPTRLNSQMLYIIPGWWMGMSFLGLGILSLLFFWLASTVSYSKERYHLAAVHLVFWSFIIIFSYAFIAVVTWDANSVTSSAFALLGISGGAAVITATTAPGNAGEKISDSKRSTHSFLKFWQDLLHDENGPVFARYQIVAWALVLGVVFIASVVNTLAMPEFDASLLTLLGISTGTYVGLRFAEERSG